MIYRVLALFTFLVVIVALLLVNVISIKEKISKEATPLLRLAFTNGYDSSACSMTLSETVQRIVSSVTL
jgi:hypothetical protein